MGKVYPDRPFSPGRMWLRAVSFARNEPRWLRGAHGPQIR